MFQRIKHLQNGLMEQAGALPLPRILSLLNILIAAAIISAGLTVIREAILAKMGTKDALSQNILSSSPVKDEGLPAYSMISKNNPFGGKSRDLSLLYKASLDMSRLGRDDLVLVGTMVGSREELSYAIFKTKGSAQEVVALKREMPGVGILDEVNRDKVFIRKGDTRFAMLIKNDKPAGFPVDVVNPPENAADQGEGRVINRTHIISAIENPVSILTDARINPVSSGKGFVLSEVKSGGFYDALGLNNGDILMDIDGHEISKPEEALKMVTAIKGMDTIRINIVRANKPESLEYFIK